jgi:hypothetical protein
VSRKQPHFRGNPSHDNTARPRTTGLRSPRLPSILGGYYRATAARLSLSRSDPSGRNPACPSNGPRTMKTKHRLGWSLISFGITTTIFTVSLSGAPPAHQQEPTTATQTDKVEPDMVTRLAVCRWAHKPPVLDGRLDDPCWQQAKVIDHFASYWNKTPQAGTRAFLVWDDEAIYYAATMSDAEVRAFGTRRNDTLWEGDVFELFLKPSAERPEYFEFQGNPRGVVFEMAFPKRGQYPESFNNAPLLGTKAVAVIDGTLDHPGDKDKGWSVEGRIPSSAFALTGSKPKPGDSWLFAICRYDYGRQGSKPVLFSSAPLTQSNFHRYEDYGTLRFEGPQAEQRKKIDQ